MTLAKRTAPLKDRTLAQERKAVAKAIEIHWKDDPCQLRVEPIYTEIELA